jgi:hypothetical protein
VRPGVRKLYTREPGLEVAGLLPDRKEVNAMFQVFSTKGITISTIRRQKYPVEITHNNNVYLFTTGILFSCCIKK